MWGEVVLSPVERGRAPRPEPARERALARHFANGHVMAGIDGVVALLPDDVWLSVPPVSRQHLRTAAISLTRYFLWTDCLMNSFGSEVAGQVGLGVAVVGTRDIRRSPR